jgi:hypothetical protein
MLGPLTLAVFVQMVHNMRMMWLESQGAVNLGHLMERVSERDIKFLCNEACG